ncbi:Retrovirus-related Pol polyprotein from transposon 17.6 [Mycena venus]|uniref:Retrovirus-related Pol polyprotein from transposon 17.6 n=1 Tax=Mycena venus TaxID=2733690 RepID=A0A8H7DFV1_9AGAR|nr:Retrovirus-related Pol polyprotein from transposon 17.6 [Mycena venus]
MEVAAASEVFNPMDTPWTRRVFASHATSLESSVSFPLTFDSFPVRRRYKRVDRKVRSVPTYMPNPSAQVFRPVIIPTPEPLPTHPPPISEFIPTDRLTKERLEIILSSIPAGYLSPAEMDLFAFILHRRQRAIAFTDLERGFFSREFFPDYEIPVIEHTPWQDPPIRIPKAIEAEVRRLLQEQVAAGKFEPCTASYRCSIFAVEKTGGLRLVINLESLNQYVVRDAALPPRVDDFAESFAGYVCYGCADLFAGFDGRLLAVASRPLTGAHSLIGAVQNTCLPQGYANAVPEFQRCTTHVIAPEIPKTADVFMDDGAIKGPRTDYNGETIPENSGIRRFVFEYAHTFDRFLLRLETAGLTASGKKLVPITPRLKIVGSIVSREGWHLSHGIVAKILKWGPLSNVSEVRQFLGTAGVGRKWIRNFSRIAKPLTLLLRSTENHFVFNDAARAAQEELKRAVTSAPVLVTVDYELARLLHPRPRTSDHGLITVAVDSSIHGSGWVVFQILLAESLEKKPAIFGSCTFNAVESRYSQPKVELYGVFRAFKDLRHRIWGVFFRLETDAQFLAKMIRSPDLPNAPMTRWINYIHLFDFEVQHIPGKDHPADGLSRRPRVEDDSDESDAEEYLTKFLGATSLLYNTSYSSFIPCPLDFSIPFSLDPPTVKSILSSISMLHSRFSMPHSYYTTRNNSTHPHTIVSLSLLLYHTPPIPDAPLFSLSLLRRIPDEALSFLDPRIQKVPGEFSTRCLLGNETNFCFFTHYSSELDSSRTLPACVSHTHAVKVEDSPALWEEIIAFLKTGRVPARVLASRSPVKAEKQFVKRAKRFFLLSGYLWMHGTQGHPPRRVIVDLERRRDILAEGHNNVGHTGRDSTFRYLWERYYWPNLYDDVAMFVRSCLVCQMRSKIKPVIPYSPSWATTILRHFHLDTIEMSRTGVGGVKYVMHAIDVASCHTEAKAAVHNDAETWAKFIYTHLICRFSCIPFITVDGGSEFKNVVRILMDRFGVTCIVSSAYHPHSNGPVERSHRDFQESLVRVSAKHPGRWPEYIPAVLFAMRVTAHRAHGYSPYFLLYGVHPVFAFDITDHTWQTLDWHDVKSYSDLISLRAQQILRRDEILTPALEKLTQSRQQSIDNMNRRMRYHSFSDFEPGMWVWRHETSLEGQHGRKEEMRWSGPYIIHEVHPHKVYTLRELNGTVIRGTVTVHRLKLFYYRPDRQTLKSVGTSLGHLFGTTTTQQFNGGISTLVMESTFLPFDNPNLLSFPTPTSL